MRKLLLLLLFCTSAWADSGIYIDQVGSNNQITITQDGDGHSINLTLGKDSPLDNSIINITQQGLGAKNANIDMPGGYNNTVRVSQDGNGSQTANITSLSGAANSVDITQSGASNNTFNILGLGINNANTITATQSGNAGADKSFTLNMSNTNGATVNIQQTNPSQPNTGSMSINCYTGCGTYSYIRN